MNIDDQKKKKKKKKMNGSYPKTEINVEVISINENTVTVGVYVGVELVGTQALAENDVLHIGPLYKEPVKH